MFESFRPAYQHVQLNYNDVGKGVDRRSYEGIYNVVDGIPRFVTLFSFFNVVVCSLI